MIGIYKITNPKGKIYIGQSVDIDKRISYYKSISCKTQPKLFRSIKKYGFENHSFDILLECKKEELNSLERYYQELYNVVNNGLNCCYVSAENKPFKRSEESNKRISEALSKRVWSDKSRRKLSNSRKGMVFTEKHRENIRISKTGANNVVSKLVINLDNGIFFESIKEASVAHNLNEKTLSKYLNGSRKNKTRLKLC